MASSVRFLKVGFLACVLAGSVFSSGAVAQDAPIALGNVPDNIIDAAKKKFAVKSFVSAEKRTIDKKLVHYNLEIKLKDKTTMDAYFDAEGKLLRTGVAIKKEDVPSAVVDSFQKTYSDWTVTGLNKETDAESNKEYINVEIERGGKTLELDFEVDGKIAKTLELKNDD